MARLPDRYDLSSAASLRSGRAIASVDTSGLTRGVQQFGNDVSAIGSDIVSVNAAKTKEQTVQEVIGTDGPALKELHDFTRSFEQDGDYPTFGKRAEDGINAIATKYASKITDPKARTQWQGDFARRAETARNSIAGLGEQRIREGKLTEAKAGLQSYQSIIADDSLSQDDRDKAKASAGASIEALMQSGQISPSEAETWRDTIVKGGEFILGQREIEKDPSVITGKLPARVSDRAGMAMSFFQQKGWTKEQAAGIVGNLLAESSLDTGAKNAGDGSDGSDSIGVAQWNSGRATALKQFARESGKDWRDLETQLSFIHEELNSSEKGAGDALRNAKDVQQATEAIIGYERPAGSDKGARGAHNYNGRLKYAQQAAGETIRPDWYASQSPDKQLQLERMADVQSRQNMAAAAAMQKAESNQAVDDFQIRIKTDPVLTEQEIISDPRLDNGQRATLIGGLRSEQKDSLLVSQAMPQFSAGTLGNSVDPYSAEGKKLVDGVAGQISKLVPPDQQQTVTEDLVRQTGLVPAPFLNGIRKGLASTDLAQIQAAAEQANRISQIDPAALGRRDGGSVVQSAADDYGFYVNNLNLSPTEAAQKIADANDPQKKRDRKILEPVAKEFLKAIDKEDIGSMFDESAIPFNDPKVGFSDAQALGIKADYKEIAEEQFYLANGDVELAKNRAKQEMQRTYGVTKITGSNVVMKYPPEKFWPGKTPDGMWDGLTGDPYGYVKDQLANDLSAIDPSFSTGTSSLVDAAGNAYESSPTTASLSNLQFVATPETAKMIKRGEMPAYQVMYTDANGVLQTIPGKLWKPDLASVDAENKRRTDERAVSAIAEGQAMRPDELKRAKLANEPDGGRAASADAFLAGPDTIPMDKVSIEPTKGKERYDTNLSDSEEASFQDWAKKNRKSKDLEDYDLRGAWKDGAEASANGHLPDTYKKPNHPTFSVESKYSTDKTLGGEWSKTEGDKWMFTPSNFNLKTYGKEKLIRYFKENEPDAVLNLKRDD